MVEAIATWEFGGNSDDLLAYKTGDLIKITALDMIIGDSKWYRAYANGEHGYIEHVMLDIKPFKWFWAGEMDREETERYLLRNQAKKFLIRESSPGSLDYFLSYKLYEGKVEHFRIYTNPDITFYFFRDRKGRKVFNSLNELAKYVNVSGFSAPWWTPCSDEEDHVKTQRKKRAEWAPNE